MNYKEFANAMRKHAVINDYGQVIVSLELWEHIACIIENMEADYEYKTNNKSNRTK